MAGANYDIIWSAPMSVAGGAGFAGTVLTISVDGSSYIAATTANLVGSSVPSGVARGDWTAGGTVALQQSGTVTNDITGLGAGVKSAVIVDPVTARMVRKANPVTADVVVGLANERGDVTLNLAGSVSGGGGGGTTIPTATVSDSYVTMSTTGVVTVQRITADQIYPAFSVALASSSNVEVGSTVATPAFTVSYGGGTPASATLNDSVPNAGKALVSPFTSVSSNASFTFSSVGQAYTFTVTATSTSGSTKTSSAVAITGLQKNYWGIGTAGQTSASFILALGSNALSSSKNGSFSATAGASQKIYFACRSAYGAATFTVGGFVGGFTKTATVSLTNASGFNENFDLYESNTANLGATTFVVS